MEWIRGTILCPNWPLTMRRKAFFEDIDRRNTSQHFSSWNIRRGMFVERSLRWARTFSSLWLTWASSQTRVESSWLSAGIPSFFILIPIVLSACNLWNFQNVSMLKHWSCLSTLSRGSDDKQVNQTTRRDEDSVFVIFDEKNSFTSLLCRFVRSNTTTSGLSSRPEKCVAVSQLSSFVRSRLWPSGETLPTDTMYMRH